ncbi:MAG: NADH-quinone oxidoreductase subunit NuoF [Planctomycetota bacterium]|nr:NADH-quinone oxidoreductase subunit NuoF [Planctomycetota bacterium]
MKAFETYLLDRAKKDGAHRLDDYKKLGGYKALEKVLKTGLTPGAVIDEMKKSNLRGRGGAGFPTGMKWSFMPDPAKDPRPRYLAINADESEPGTCKDRVLMERDPHGLVEGSLIAAYAIRAQAVYIYVRGEYRKSHDRVRDAVLEARAAKLVGKNILGSDFSCEVFMHKGAGAYICGEETGLMESLEGKRGHPRPKPPFPAMSGLWGKPTTVNNVETVFNAPFIIERGGAWLAGIGTKGSSGNFLCGISGHVNKPGVYELPFGVTAQEIVEEKAGGIWKGRGLKAWFPGGSSCALLTGKDIDVVLDHDSLKARGSSLGTAAMIMIDDQTSMARVMEIIARFYDHESCGQCSQCREGTQWLSQIFHRIAAGKGQPDDVDTLDALAKGMAPGKTICALSDAAAIPTLSAIKLFREELMTCVREKRDPLAVKQPEYAVVGAH